MNWDRRSIIYRVANIFNMVSKPNFVLGIKQTSLHSKKDSYMHCTNSQCPLLNFRSRLYGITQPPWLTTVSRSSSPSNLCLSLSNLCKSRIHLMKPTTQMCSTAFCNQNPGSWSPQEFAHATTCRPKFQHSLHALPHILDSWIVFWAHMLP